MARSGDHASCDFFLAKAEESYQGCRFDDMDDTNFKSDEYLI